MCTLGYVSAQVLLEDHGVDSAAAHAAFPAFQGFTYWTRTSFQGSRVRWLSSKTFRLIPVVAAENLEPNIQRHCRVTGRCDGKMYWWDSGHPPAAAAECSAGIKRPQRNTFFQGLYKKAALAAEKAPTFQQWFRLLSSSSVYHIQPAPILPFSCMNSALAVGRG